MSAAALIARIVVFALPSLCLSAVDFQTDILPVMQSRCFACHGPTMQLSGLRLDRKDDARKGGKSGKPAVVPGDSSASLLVRYISGLDPKIVMPPSGGRLTEAQIDLLRKWVDEGAVQPAEMPAEFSTKSPGNNHWAFQPLSHPAVPGVRARDWVRNPIDSFILAKLEAKGWKPAPTAEPRALLRRVFQDLIGVPPTVPEQDAFLTDPRPDRFERVVAELLSRPGYGARWARHWLDIVRYAETNGYERDGIKPNVWRYRDYVIRAFNQDKPYDRFVMEQLAGDELPETSAETLIATSYFRLGPWDDEPADRAQDRADQLDDIVSTTSQVFLGITLGCARCHDHKFDPFTQKDYYSMVAIFNGLQRPHYYRNEFDLPAGTRMQLRAEAERNTRIVPLEKQIEEIKAPFRSEFLMSGKSKLPPEGVEASLVEPANRTEVQMAFADGYAKVLDAEVVAAMPAALKAKTTLLEEEIRKIKKVQPDLPRGYFMQETGPIPPPTYVLGRGSAAAHGQEVDPAVPAVLASEQPKFVPGGETSRRRLAFAGWLVNPQNPLLARVIVNRVWQFHFGEGLVGTPSDFGRIGDKPTHPELLDWLADWFIKQGWSLKQLHRLILSSSAYRMSKTWNAEYGAADPEDRLLWRMPNHRLEVEAIRDSILAISGQLNPQNFGPSIYPPIPQGVLEASGKGEHDWIPSGEEEAARRTIYIHVKRSMILPMMEVLDFCDTSRSSAKRVVTIVAPQALTLFNGDVVNKQARHFARRLINEAGPSPEKQVERGYLLALGRPPSPSEMSSMTRFLSEETAKLRMELGTEDGSGVAENAEQKALAEMCRVIFNLNELVYPD